MASARFVYVMNKRSMRMGRLLAVLGTNLVSFGELMDKSNQVRNICFTSKWQLEVKGVAQSTNWQCPREALAYDVTAFLKEC